MIKLIIDEGAGATLPRGQYLVGGGLLGSGINSVQLNTVQKR